MLVEPGEGVPPTALGGVKGDVAPPERALLIVAAFQARQADRSRRLQLRSFDVHRPGKTLLDRRRDLLGLRIVDRREQHRELVAAGARTAGAGWSTLQH